MEIKDGKNHILEVKELIIEYTQLLNRDLSFQNLEEELKDPGKKYTPPEGELLIAIEEGKILGMVAYHKLNEKTCEMKRLYVKPDTRGKRIGDELVREIISHARDEGYSEMVLDTIKPLKPAINLYKKYGFEECEPYYNNPMDDVIYMKKEL